MTSTIPVAEAVSGDARIAGLLADAIVIPAFACKHLDGFVNDTFTEYANASIYRPDSVREARLVSKLREVIRARGRFYLGFTMYASAGVDEAIDVWVGHRQVARASLDDPDNRLHLFFAPEKEQFKGGESIWLYTNAADGPCRIENVVLLSKRPRLVPQKLAILSPRVDVRADPDKPCALLTWRTNRPAKGRVIVRPADGSVRTARVNTLLTNHEVILSGLPKGSTAYEIEMRDRTGRLTTSERRTFRGAASHGSRSLKEGRFTLPIVTTASHSWPVTVGVPFAIGSVADPARVRLVDSDNVSVPVQVGVQSRWEDGSIKWALLDFHSDGRSSYAVEFGLSVRTDAGGGLKVRSVKGAIVVATGAMTIRIPRDRVVLPGVVEVEQPDGSTRCFAKPDEARRRVPAICVVDGAGQVYHSGKPDRVVVEANGPERACILIECRHRGRGTKTLMQSILRLHFFRDSRRVRVEHTFVTDGTGAHARASEFEQIRSLSLNLPVDVGAAIERCEVAGTTGGPLELTQLQDNRFTVRRHGKEVSAGRHADGSALMESEGAAVRLAMRDFWQNYPKGLAVDDDGFRLDICPELDPSTYPRGGELEDRLFYYLLDGRYKLKQGVAKTHEFWLSYAPDSEPLRAVQNPPLYRVPLSVLNDSEAWTQLPPKDPSPYPPYEAWVKGAHMAYAADRVSSRAYGMLNFGDWFGERKYNWGNMEYDTPWCFLQEFLRGGEADFFRWADEAARHLVDVDTNHANGGETPIDTHYIHSVGHVGKYYPDGYRESAMFFAMTMVSHTWVEGLFLHALLTGDARSRESALLVSLKLAGEMLNHFDFTNCRESGWHLIHLFAAYRATGRRFFVNAARIIVERVLERQRASGGWDRLMVPGHCHCDPPRHTGNAGFMVGILMVGLKRFHEVTGDEVVADSIVRAAGYCIDTMWVPDKATFRYTCCPDSGLPPDADMRILKGVAAAYQFTGEERFKRVLEAGIQTAIQHPPTVHRGVGKTICSPMRGAPQIIGSLPKRPNS